MKWTIDEIKWPKDLPGGGPTVVGWGGEAAEDEGMGLVPDEEERPLWTTTHCWPSINISSSFVICDYLKSKTFFF